MSKKKKIIISVTAAVLVLAMVLTCVAVVIGNKKDREREREEYEQVQNATNNHETSDPSETTPDSDIPLQTLPYNSGLIDSTMAMYSSELISIICSSLIFRH